MEIAQEHYDHWFEAAKGFFEGYGFYLSKEKFNLAAFSLHQSAEAAYKTILLVLTNYCPQEHFLGLLSGEAEVHNGRLIGVFPQKTKTDEERFKLLDYAYIGARYDPKYKISESDLRILSKCTERLLELTEEICQHQFDCLAASRDFPGE